MYNRIKQPVSFRMIIGIAIAAVGIWPCHAGQKPFSITSKSCLVVNKDQATDCQAAAELQEYLEKITGKKVPIEYDGAVTPGAYVIAVGDNSYTAPLAERLKSLKRDSFIIKSTPQALLIRGKPKSIRHPADFPAVQYAASFFLQTYCGVRWYLPAPGNLGTVVPKKEDILLNEFEDVQQPDFIIRLWGGLIDEKLESEWNRHNYSGMAYIIQHTLTDGILNPEMFKEHPDFFALYNGQRSSQPGWAQVCTSNPELVKFLVDFVNRCFDEHPDREVISMGQGDGSNYCECANCKASGVTISDRLYPFYAEIARQLQVKHPGKQVGLLCYADAKAFPSKTEKYANVAIAMPWDRSAWFDRETREKDEALTREWSKRVDRVFLWNWYWSAGFITPQVFPHTVDRVVKFAGSLGNCDGIYNETYSHIALPGPKLWVLAQLLWKSSTPVDALLDDFCKGMFGKGGVWMRKYYDLQEEAWCRQKVMNTDLFDKWRYNIAQLDLFSADDMEKQRAYLKKAAEAVDTEDDRARVDMMAKTFTQFDLSWQLYQQMKKATQLGKIDSEKKAEAAERILAGIFKKHRDLDDFQKTVVAPRKELQYYLGDWWTPTYEWFIADLAGYLTGMKQTERIRKVMGQLGKEYPGLEGGRLAAAIGEAQGLPSAENMIMNPDLEKSGFTVNGLARDDWVADEACPAGWYRWPKETRESFCVSEDGSGGRRRFSGIRGIGSGSQYIQVVKVVPGKRYFISFEAFPQMVSAGGGGGVNVQYWEEKTKWLGLTEAEKASGAKGSVNLFFHTGVENRRWHRMVGTVLAPPRAQYLVLSLGSKNFGKEDSILFKDLRMFPLESSPIRAHEKKKGDPGG